MKKKSTARFGFLALIGAALVFPVIPVTAYAQGGIMNPLNASGGGTIIVYVRDEFGAPLSIVPQINLTVTGMANSPPRPPQTAGDGWVFSGLPLGQDYQVEVEAEGYQTAYESTSLPYFDNASTNVIVFLKPVGQNSSSLSRGGQFVLAPRAEKEVEHGLKDLRSRRFESARKHLEKALQMAPGNPYVNYVMGMIYLLSKQAEQAKPFLEKSVSIDPKHPPSLLALGTVRFELADYSGAIQVLEQDVQLDATSWKAEWMLADSYLGEKNYAKAQEYAERALKTGKENAAQARLVVGDALAGLGEREKAAATFDNYLRSHPNDANAAKIRGFMEALKQPLSAPAKPAVVGVATHATSPSNSAVESPQTAPATSLGIAASAPAVELPPKENWAPPDIDVSKPFAISGAACSLSGVLKSAQQNALEFVNVLQEFSAIEDYQSVEIKRDEQLERPESRQFNYLVLIEQIRPGLFHVGESRSAVVGRGDLPGILADMGAPGLALVFHPYFQGDFDWICEGLGKWKDRSTWIVHFEQRKNRPTSLLTAYDTPSHEYALPLKGRAWITQNTGRVVHLETDLTHPMSEIGLMREHFSIDYAPISFKTHKVELWLPEDVDVYYQFRGHYIHNFHQYSKFQLFWVGASAKMGHPKETKQN